MALIDAREIKPMARILIRQVRNNHLKKGVCDGSPGYVVATESVGSSE